MKVDALFCGLFPKALVGDGVSSPFLSSRSIEKLRDGIGRQLRGSLTLAPGKWPKPDGISGQTQ